MQCRTCGTLLPSGTAFCPHCGSPVTIVRPDGIPDTSANDQTVLSAVTPPPPPPSDPYNAPSVLQVPVDPYSVPSTPQAFSDPYSMPPVSSGPYQAPIGATNYGSMPSPYPKSTSGYSNETISAASGAGTFSAPDMNNLAISTPLPASPQKRKRGRLVAVIVGIIALLIIGSCAGFWGISALVEQGHSAATATASASNSVPSDTSVVSSASAIFSSLQLSSAVDSTYSPTNVTSTFTVGQTVYVTFTINSNGNDGYIMGRWYLNGVLIYRKEFHHIASHNFGYFSLPYQQAGKGAFALYWCTKLDCSDAQLAQVAHFAVTN